VRIRFQDEDFECEVRAHAWQAARRLVAVDGTVELAARSTVSPARRVLGFIHGRLERPSVFEPFVIPVGAAEFDALLAKAREEWEGEEGVRPLRLPEARWCMAECPVPTPTRPGTPARRVTS
jgi:hypothetical protein